MKDRVVDIAIVGAGIAGLAHAYHALKKGYSVVLFERDAFAVGASIRNFGLIWPVGQRPGPALDTALRSRMHWLELARNSGSWINQNGSLHLAYHDDEWSVLNEFVDMYSDQEGLDLSLLGRDQIQKLSPRVETRNLLGGMYSKTECTVNSREVLMELPEYLVQKLNLKLEHNTVVKEIDFPEVKTNRGNWRVDKVIVCGGAEFELLYPELFKEHSFMKCKLQMMKGRSVKPFDLGPSLCAGLTLRHYPSFTSCPSLKVLDMRYDAMNSLFKKYGIHVLVSQNNAGELIIGDSHEYGNTLHPFESEQINQLILEYAASFIDLTSVEITERWHGVYPKSKSDSYVFNPERHVSIVNGLGGAGMTLSLGVAEQVINFL